MKSSVRFMLTITALVGALLFAGPVGAQPTSFLGITENIDGVVGSTIGPVTAVLGGIPLTTYVVDGEDGWVNAGGSASNPGIFSSKSVLKSAVRTIVGGNPADASEIIIANLQPGDPIIAVAIAQGVTAASLAEVVNGTKTAAASGILQLVTADFFGANGVGNVLNAEKNGMASAMRSVYPNMATSAVSVANSTVAIFIWNGRQDMTNSSSVSIAASNFVVSPTATTTTATGNTVSVAVVGGATNGTSSQIGVDLDGPTFFAAADSAIVYATESGGVNVKQMYYDYNKLGGVAGTALVNHVTNDNIVEFRAADLLVVGVSIATNCLKDGEPDAYFGNAGIGTDPLNAAKGTGLIIDANANNLIQDVSVVPGSIVVKMQNDLLTDVDGWATNPNPTWLNNFFDMTGDVNDNLPVISNVSVVVDTYETVQTKNNDGLGFYSPELVLCASFVVKDVSTPRQQDNGNLTTTFYIGDDIGLSGPTAIANATNAKSTTVTRKVDTRPPYVAAVQLNNNNITTLKTPNSTANQYKLATLGEKAPYLGIQVNLDLNGDGLTNAQSQYIVTVTDVLGLVSVTGSLPGIANAVQMTASNTTIPNGFFTVDGNSSSSTYNTITSPAGLSQTVFGASLSQVLHFDTNDVAITKAAAYDIYNASLIFKVTDDARNVITYYTNPASPVNFPLADGAINGYPRPATFAIDPVSADILIVNTGMTALNQGHLTESKLLPLFSSANYPGTNPYEQNLGGANVRLVTYTASGASMAMTVAWNAERDGDGDNISDTLAKSNVLGIAASASGSDKLSISDGTGPFVLGVVLTATNGTAVNQSISYTVASSTAADLGSNITACTAELTFNLPTNLFGSVTDANGRTGRPSWIPGGVDEASFAIKITDRVGNYDGGANAAEFITNNSLSNDMTDEDFSNNISIQADAPEVFGQIAANAKVARVTPSSGVNNVVVFVTNGVNFPETVLNSNGTSNTAVIDPVTGLQAPYQKTMPPNTRAWVTLTPAAANDPVQIGHALGSASVGSVTSVFMWDSVKANDYIIVSATVVPPFVAGWTRQPDPALIGVVPDSLASVTAGIFTPIADYFTEGAVAGVPSSATVSLVSNLITADFSDFVTTANAVVPVASLVVAQDGTAYPSRFVGTATKDEIVVVTFAVKLDQANLNGNLGSTDVRLVTITAQSPMGPKTSAGIYAATKTAFAAHSIAIESFKYGKTASTLQPISSAVVGNASVGVNNIVQAVAKILLNGVYPNASDGSPKNFVGLNLTDFYPGAADVQPDSLQVVTAAGTLENVGSGASTLANLVAGATPIYATWTYTLSTTTAASAVKAAASLTVGVTTTGGLRSATSTNTLGAGGALNGALQSDLHPPTITSVQLYETSINNSKSTGTVDTKSDTVIRIKDGVMAAVRIDGDAADMYDANKNVVDGSGNSLASSLINYVSLNLGNFVLVDIGTPTYKVVAGVAKMDKKNVASITLEASFPLTIRTDNPQGNLFTRVISATSTDMVGNAYGPSSNSNALFFENTPPTILVANIGLSVSQFVNILGPSTMDSNLTLNTSNGLPGIAGLWHPVTETVGHQEAVSSEDQVRVTAVVNAGEDYVTFPSQTGIITADLSQFGFTKLEEPNEKVGDTTIQATWTVTLPNTVASVPYTSGASVVVRVTDSAEVSNAQQDNATITIDVDAPALVGKVEFRRGNGELIVGEPVSGIATSRNYASMTIQLTGTFTQPDFGSTAWASGGDPMSITNAILTNISDYGWQVYEVTPTYMVLAGLGEPVSSQTAIATLRKSTNSTLTAIYGGIGTSAPLYPGLAYTPNATKGLTAPGFPVRSSASTKAAPSVVVYVSDRIGNVNTFGTSFLAVDNSAPTFNVKSVTNSNPALQRVKGGGTVKVEFTVQDPITNTNPITVRIDAKDFEPSAAQYVTSSGLTETPGVAISGTTVTVSNIKPIDANTPGAVTLTLTVGSGAASGDIKRVTLQAMDNIDINSSRFGTTDSVTVDTQPPDLLLAYDKRYKVINKSASDLYALSNLQEIKTTDAPSVAPGDIVFVSQFYKTDALTSVTTDIADKLNIGVSTRVNASSVKTSYRLLESNSTFGTGSVLPGKEDLWWVTVTIPILSTADPIQPQNYNMVVTDSAGNTTTDGTKSLGVNAVGVVVNTAQLTIIPNPNGDGSNGNIGGVGGIGPNGPDAPLGSVADELTTGDQITVHAELSVFDQSTPIDKYLVLDASSLYQTTFAGVAANIVPTVTGIDQISGIFTADWTKAVMDFDGAASNVKAVTFASLVNTGANRVPPTFNVNWGIIANNGIGSGTTTNPVQDSQGNVSVQDANGTSWTIVGAPNIAVQQPADPQTYANGVVPVTRAAIVVTGQDSEASLFPEASLAAGYVAVDTQRPYGIYSLVGEFASKLPSGAALQLEASGVNAGYPITLNQTNSYNRVSSRDQVRAIVNFVNPIIRNTLDTVGDGDDLAYDSAIVPITNTLSNLHMDLSQFAGTGNENVLSTNPGRLAGPVAAGSASLWTASWTVSVSNNYGKTVSGSQLVRDVTFFFEDDVQNNIKMTKTSEPLAIDNLAPSISQTGLVASLKQGSYTTSGGSTVTTPGYTIPTGSRIAGSAVAASVIIRVSAPITESIDNPNDVLRNQFGDVALTVQDDDPAKLFAIPSENIQLSFSDSSVAQNVLFAIFEVTMPLALDTVGTSSFKFVVSATDSIGNPTTVVTTPSFAFDGRPSLLSDVTTDPITIEAGNSKIVTFTAFDQGGVAAITITPVTDAASDEVTFSQGSLSGADSTTKTRTKTLTINTVENRVSTVGADTGPFSITATATDNDPLTVSLSPALNVVVNQPVLTAGIMNPVTGVVYEGDSLIIDVSGVDANLADNISLSIGGTLFTSSELVGLVTFNTPALIGSASTSNITGTGGEVDGQIVLNTNYHVIPPFVSGSVGNATQVGYSVIVRGADGSSNDPDSSVIMNVTVTQKTPQPTLVIQSIKVNGVTKTAPGGSININEGDTIEVTVEATDVSGDYVTITTQNVNNAPYSFVSTPSIGSATGKLTFTASYSDAGASYDPFTTIFKAAVPADTNEDGSVGVNEEVAAYQVLLTNIDNVSQPPSFRVSRGGQSVVVNTTQTVGINQTLEYVVNISDIDGELVLLNAPTLVPAVEGVSVSMTPTTVAGVATATGTVTVTIGSLAANAATNLVISGQGGADTITKYIGLNITTGTNPPVLAVTPSALTVSKGQTASFSVSVVDADGDTITLDDGAAGGSFATTQVGTTLTGTYTFSSATAGTFNITITATANSQTDTEPITVTVTDLPAGVNEVKPGIAVGSGIGGLGGQSRFQIFSATGSAFDGVPGSYVVSNATTQLFASAGDVNKDGVDEVVFGNSRRDITSPSIPAGIVGVFNSKTRSQITSMVPFPPAPFTTDFDYNPSGEIRVAVGDLIGDSAEEVVIAQGPGAQSRLRIASLVSGSLENNKANTYRPLFLGNPADGVNIACGDLEGSGKDVIVAAMAGPNTFGDVAQIQLLKPASTSGTTITSMFISNTKQATFGSGTNPSGGIRVACGDVDGDGKDEVIVVSALSSTANGGNRLMILKANASPFSSATPFSVMTDGTGGQISHAIFSSGSNPNGSLYISAVDIDADGKDEIVVGRGEGAANEFIIYKIDATQTGLGVFVQQGIYPTFSGNTGFGTAVGAGYFGR